MLVCEVLLQSDNFKVKKLDSVALNHVRQELKIWTNSFHSWPVPLSLTLLFYGSKFDCLDFY